MDNDQILIDICEMVYQRSILNKANVAPSAVKKDTPKLKKPRKPSFKQHFQESMSNKDFLDLFDGDKQQFIDGCIMHIRFFISTRLPSSREAAVHYSKKLLQMYKSETYRDIIDKMLAHNKEYPLDISVIKKIVIDNNVPRPWSVTRS